LILSTQFAVSQRDRDTYINIQPIEVTGHIRIAETGEPARNVQVRLERFSGGVVEQMLTDSQGRFRFGGLARGYYTVIIDSPGYAPARQAADLQVVFRSFHIFDLTKNDPVSLQNGVLDVRIPPAAASEYDKARSALTNKDPKEAIGHLKKAVSIHPEFFEAQLLLGTSLMDLRRWPEAESALRRALDIKSDHVNAKLALGETYWRQKRFDEAERTLLEGLKVDVENWHGHFTIGRLYWERGDIQKAATAIGRTLQIKPEFAEAHLLAGNILLKFNQPQRALAEYEEYLRLAPEGEFAAESRVVVQKLRAAGIKPVNN
jgi:predicted Zn-dependent protease/5-hydroxyisourate hydrolase-like protein (transthyretin family)